MNLKKYIKENKNGCHVWTGKVKDKEPVLYKEGMWVKISKLLNLENQCTKHPLCINPAHSQAPRQVTPLIRQPVTPQYDGRLKHEIAWKMFKEGKSRQEIAKYFGKSTEEIKELIKDGQKQAKQKRDLI